MLENPVMNMWRVCPRILFSDRGSRTLNLILTYLFVRLYDPLGLSCVPIWLRKVLNEWLLMPPLGNALEPYHDCVVYLPHDI